jgi:hypothetical protein
MRPFQHVVRCTTLLLAISAAISGCATKKEFYAMGGSRADGTVDMAYEFQQFESPVVSLQQAQAVAKSKCSVWGYRDAEPFGGKSVNCHQRNGFGTCVAGQVLVKYQCIGNLDAAPASVASRHSPSPVEAAAPNGSLSKGQWQEMQLQQLTNEKGLSYEEYQRRYKLIMAQ